MSTTKNIIIMLLISFLSSSCSIKPSSLALGVSGLKLKASNKTVEKERNDYNLIAITPTLVKTNINRKNFKSNINRKQYQTSQLSGRSITSRYAYKIGVQDVLSIIVWDHPELTSDSSGYVVQTNGQFFFPYIGHIQAKGRMVDDIRQEITEKLAETLVNPQVGVSISKFRSQYIDITGEIEKPSTLTITDRPLTILGAIAAAGGRTELADKENILLKRNGKVQKINFNELARNNLLQNIVLQHGDLLHIEEDVINKVFVMGEVAKSGSITYDLKGMTLAEAISSAGGLKEETASPTGMFILRQEESTGEKPTVYQLDFSSVDSFLLAEKFNLRNRDVVYITAADATRWNRVISQILPTTRLF